MKPPRLRRKCDTPRPSRIRRRGSAEVDYIQTKALADKREPGDTAADPTPNIKAPPAPEKQETQSLDNADEANEDGFDIDGATPFEAPTDAAPPLTPSADISTASDAPASSENRTPQYRCHRPI